jgi:probable phosphoglycerate mutase
VTKTLSDKSRSGLPQVPFWFLRHGQTDYNAQGLSQGALDIPLNEIGRQQARQAGLLLRHRGIVSIVCSPMLRTRETAAVVNDILNLPIAFEPGLREVVFGGMEGKPLAPWFQRWMAGVETPPGAESFTELTRRASEAMRQILNQPCLVLIIAHGGVFRALRHLMRASQEGLTPNGQPLFCAPSGGSWKIKNAEQDL